MKLGVRTTAFGDRPLDEALTLLREAGVDAVELSCGGYAGTPFVTATEAVNDESLRTALLERTGERGVEVAALGSHNNPLHPDPEVAIEADRELRAAIELADQLGVDVVSCFSGLPGGSPDDATPTWVTAPWPEEHRAALEYQWDEVAVPYWRELESVAAARDVTLAVEMHLNMLVHTPLDICRLREATGEHLSATFDPSHLYPQSIDIFEAAAHLAANEALGHVHLKDVRPLERNARLGGVLDATPWSDRTNRSWTFTRPGVGHGAGHWARLFDTLRRCEYDGCLAIEYFRGEVEDPVTSIPKTADIVRSAL
jgi:DNA-(apurinic or apyrimidinic site) lyase